jgi:glycerophosphoryl diester phosphodiesterase
MNDSIAMQYVIYEMDYSTIQTFDCGSKIHPRFPQQQKMNATKPLLSNVIDEVEAYVKQNGLPAVQYNIETKLSPEGDGELHPKPDTFVTLLMQVVRDKGIAARTIVQSFDPRTLEIMHERHPDIRLALLVENDEGITYNLDRLTFLPDIYSPDFTLLDKEKVEELQQKGLKVIPWTVNEREDIQKVINTGVDGIISDYPDRVMEVVKDGKSVGA